MRGAVAGPRLIENIGLDMAIPEAAGSTGATAMVMKAAVTGETIRVEATVVTERDQMTTMISEDDIETTMMAINGATQNVVGMTDADEAGQGLLTKVIDGTHLK